MNVVLWMFWKCSCLLFQRSNFCRNRIETDWNILFKLSVSKKYMLNLENLWRLAIVFGLLFYDYSSFLWSPFNWRLFCWNSFSKEWQLQEGFHSLCLNKFSVLKKIYVLLLCKIFIYFFDLYQLLSRMFSSLRFVIFWGRNNIVITQSYVVGDAPEPKQFI